MWYKRMIVKLRQKKRRMVYETAVSELLREELQLFNTVLDISKTHRDKIRFDPFSSEILIVVNEEHILVTLTNQTVSIENTNGFLSFKLPSKAYDLLVSKIEKDAHSERLALKYGVKMRIREFLNKINNDDAAQQ